MQFETCVPTEVLVVLDLTIKPFLAFTLGYLSDSSLCRASTVPAGTIRSNFFQTYNYAKWKTPVQR